MSYRVEIDYAPAYELLSSFTTYINRSKSKVLSLGQEWLHSVDQQLEPSFAEELSRFKDKFCIDWLTLLIWRSPKPRTPESFFSWLESFTPGGLYELMVPYLLQNSMQNLGDLGGWRDQCVNMLRKWNEQYFQHIHPDILEQLEQDALAKTSILPVVDVERFAEQTSGGLFIEPSSELELVVFVPSYHIRPLTLYSKHKSVLIVTYPFEPVADETSGPPAQLVRITRALADETRLKILQFLVAGQRRFIDVVQFTGLSKSAVHSHLLILRVAGLIRVHIHYDSTERYSLRADAFHLLKGQLESFLGLPF
jgi:DNA-binding transcriptional ArsR family regulator